MLSLANAGKVKESKKPHHFAMAIPQVQETVFRYSGLSLNDLRHVVHGSHSFSLGNIQVHWKQCYEPGPSKDKNHHKLKDGNRRGLLKHGHWIKTVKGIGADVFPPLGKSPRGGTQCLKTDVRMHHRDLLGSYSTTIQQEVRNISLLTTRAAGSQNQKCHGFRSNTFSPLAQGVMELNPGALTSLDLSMLLVGNELSVVLNRHFSHLQSSILVQCQLSGDVFDGLCRVLENLKIFELKDHHGLRASTLSAKFKEGLKDFLKNVPGLITLRLEFVVISLFE